MLDARYGLAVLLLFSTASCAADPQAVTPPTGADVAVDPGDIPRGLEVPLARDGAGLHDGATPRDTAHQKPDGDVESPDAPTPDTPPSDAPVASGIQARSCTHMFAYTPPPADTPVAIYVPASFNGWDETALPMSLQADGSWRVEFAYDTIASGTHAYKFRVTFADGGVDWRLDPANIMKRFDDGVVNSKLIAPDCHRPALELLERSVDPDTGSMTVEVAVRSGISGGLDLASPIATHNGDKVGGAWDAERGSLLVTLDGLAAGKHTLRFDAAAAAGPAEPLVTSAWFEDTPFEWRDAVMYFAFVDRFRDADPSGTPSPCSAADPLGNWLGGDWPGILEKIESGYFDSIGVNTLWINAPMDNPDDCVPGIGGYTYTAYHGYFPVDLYAPEEHFGDLDDLRALIMAAHARGIRVLVDLVTNHVYETAAEWTEHEFDGWFNTPIYVCGWDQPETCWFQSYLPDFDFREDAVVEHVTEAALWWVREVDVDGFRVDAVKHVHPHLLHTLRAKLDTHVEAHQDLPFWTVGETFVGQWGGGSDGSAEATIKSYIGDDQLYGQFDFPLYWAILSALGRREVPMTALGDVLLGVDSYFAGDLMVSFLGNHDVARYLSHANGDINDLWGNGATQQGWESPPEQPAADEPYSRLEMAFAFLAAGPWVPLIYYGDEIGLAGAGDPDNRRMMPWSGLTPRQAQVRARVGELMTTRRANRALRRGALSVPHAAAETLTVVRSDGTSEAVAFFNRGTSPEPMSAGVSATAFVDAATGATVTASAGIIEVTVPPGRARLLTTSD